MTTITFGKYNGQDTKKIAAIDPGYCEWAVANLRSATWRNIFAQALRHAEMIPAATIANVIHTAETVGEIEGDCNYDATLRMVEAGRAQAARQQTIDEAKAAIVRRWSQDAQLSESKVRGIISGFATSWEGWSSWKMTPASKFSSPRMYEIFRRYMAEYEAVK